ncbi:3-hydroxyacyl-CoA dehydrogenase [Lactobacillus alvi]|uniref:3-hydroxyacyl-CoA dehydrogenase n=1 Tax=Limosilactobacillus alvi TaxID=990412 RepID=A0ABS2EPJ0_9LACO|nr:3-hydroxyacyl-CoA dehydrogenase [Limosilactobacillus alvi]MBM6754359.1 3-hydroxyacyl-CoA dehydrogenase [Limosilactobacillus alvi]
MAIQNLAVIGAGTLGSQIAFQSALKGINVAVWNRHLDKAKHRLQGLKPHYQKDLNLAGDAFDTAYHKMFLTTDLAEAVKDADLVIEAVPEAIEIKAQMYAELAKVLSAKTIVASNSSTFMPSQLVQYIDRTNKFLHIHFANEIWKYNVAEIVGTSATDPTVIEDAVAFAKTIGMVPIQMHKEYPGYILNALLVPFLNAAMTAWAKGIADPHEIDKDWMISTGAPSGPFMIMDIVGLRTPYQISMNDYNQTGNPDAKLIADKLKEMIDAGHYGQEAGEGFYHYPNAEFLDPNFLKA